MTCPDAMLLSQILDGELSSIEAESIQPHLDACAACQDRLGELRRVTNTGRLAMAAAGSGPGEAPRGDCLAPDRLAGWVAGQLPPDELRSVELHLAAPVLGVEEMAAAPSTVRADERTDAVSFRILAPEAKIHATVVTEGDAVGLSLTLLGSDDDALGGQRVFLRRHGRSIYSARTDAAGALEMPRLEPGVYEVACPGIGTSFRLDLRR